MNSALHKVLFLRAIASCRLAFEDPSCLPLSRSRRYACRFIYCNERHNENAKANEISSYRSLYYIKIFVLRINTLKEVLNLGRMSPFLTYVALILNVFKELRSSNQLMVSSTKLGLYNTHRDIFSNSKPYQV
jgi:hypothetical protein